MNNKFSFSFIWKKIKIQIKKINFLSLVKKINYLAFLKYLFLFLVAFLFSFPFYFMIITSFKSTEETIQNSLFSLPTKLCFSNYKEAFITKFNFIKYFYNTIVMVFFSTFCGIICCILTAFALSILNFRSSKIILMLLLLCLMIASETLVLPNYRNASNWRWVNNGKDSTVKFGVEYAMILPYLVNVVHILLLIRTFKSVPKELYYTSKVDGTTDWKYLWKILIPITKPTIIIITIFRIVAAWNAYAWPELIGAELLTNMARKIFDTETGIDAVNIQMAVTVLINLPLFLIFICFKKYIISGENRSGIKG